VAERCMDTWRSAVHNFDRIITRGSGARFMWLVGFCHDLGKATAFFQGYLFETDADLRKKKKNDKKTSHALLSAVLAHWVIRQYLKENQIGNADGLDRRLPFFAFLIIKRHHGNLNNAVPTRDSEAPEELQSTEFEHLDEQLGSLQPTEINFLFSLINEKIGISLAFEKLPRSLNEYYKKEIMWKEKRVFKSLLKRVEYYLLFQFMFSLLLYADKSDVVFNTSPKGMDIERKPLGADIVKQYKTTQFGDPENKMDRIRDAIFRDANMTILHTNLSNRIYSLNVPTGTGKTLTSLSVALRLKKRIESAGSLSRIIYALPYTTIIDQNFTVFQDIIMQPSSDVLLKHHHLADVFYRTEKEEFEASQSKFLIESWESEIVVTTFFQVFHTLFTNRNRMIQKFHKLAGSIVLLDEVQSISYKYWKLVRETLLKATELLDMHIILITATQPRIFEKEEMVELVPKKANYFSKMDRVDIYFEKAPVPLADFIEMCKAAIGRSEESFLFVMNTINSAIALFEVLKGLVPEGECFFLSTNIIPRHRMERILQIKNSTQRKIVIATQMVEAGVDISMDNVWRDFGPLEAINQVCGRCNRNFGEKRGKVQIFQILNDNSCNTPFANYIYGKLPLSLPKTMDVLGGCAELSESGFLENMDRYYETINRDLNPDTSNKCLDYMRNFQFFDLFDSFKLIDDPAYERKDVFIEIDDRAKFVWDSYVKMKEIQNPFERRQVFLKIKRNFSDYVISVPAKYVHEKEYKESNFVYIGKCQIENCYENDIGWIRTNDSFKSYFF
jgi:CRISPR-associated endonuclease/helicase Cas3